MINMMVGNSLLLALKDRKAIFLKQVVQLKTKKQIYWIEEIHLLLIQPKREAYLKIKKAQSKFKLIK